jgi:protein TonB
MLAYAANTPSIAARTGSPKALTLIIAGHALAIAAVMTAKMELVPIDSFPIVELIDVRSPPPPPPPPTGEVKPERKSTQETFIDSTDTVVDMGQAANRTLVDTGPTIRDIITDGGTMLLDPPRVDPVRIAARFITAESAIKPPYPLDKRRTGEEATLKLRITIDARGRVTSVEPVGPADPSFLEAARRHILKSWRYKPATEDGVAVPTTVTFNLSFRLEEV